MLLLSWHGTVACLRPAGLGLLQLPPDGPFEEAAPLELEIAAQAPDAPQRVQTSLGRLEVRKGHTQRGICLARYGKFLCAEGDLRLLAFDREGDGPWETFLPMSAEDFSRLAQLLREGAGARLEPGFYLVVGEQRVDLTTGMP